MSRTASCSCGQMSITVEGEPLRVLVCHCFECQKQTGSVFGSWGYWPKSAISSIEGEATLYRRSSDAGRWVDNFFCPVCGSSIYGYSEGAPDEVTIAVGNFADASFEPPDAAIWAACRHGWFPWPEQVPEYLDQPDL